MSKLDSLIDIANYLSLLTTALLQVEKLLVEKNLSGKVKTKKVIEKNDGVSIGIVNKKTASAKDGLKVGHDL